MSKEGIQIAANAFFNLQEARRQLLELGSKDCKGKSGHQDLLLASLMFDANEAVKTKFCKITLEKT